MRSLLLGLLLFITGTAFSQRDTLHNQCYVQKLDTVHYTKKDTIPIKIPYDSVFTKKIYFTDTVNLLGITTASHDTTKCTRILWFNVCKSYHIYHDSLYKYPVYSKDSSIVKDSIIAYKDGFQIDSKDTIKVTDNSYYKPCDVITPFVPFYGVLPYNISDADNKVSVLKSLDVTYSRSRITLNNYNGRSGELEKYMAGGFKNEVNILNKPIDGLIDFPTNTTQVQATITEIFTDYPGIHLAAIENEESNFENYYKGDIQNYIAELKAAVIVGKKFNIAITNGGLQGIGLYASLYRHCIAIGDITSANEVAKLLNPTALKAAKTPGSNPDIDAKIDRINTLIAAYKNIDLTYVNFHNYPYPGGDLTIIYTALVKFLHEATGKKIISNEIGSMTQDGDFTTEILTGLYNAGVNGVWWFSGDNVATNVTGLTDSKGNLTENGKAFKKFVDSKNKQYENIFSKFNIPANTCFCNSSFFFYIFFYP